MKKATAIILTLLVATALASAASAVDGNLPATTTATDSVAVDSTSVAKPHRNLVQRIIGYFDDSNKQRDPSKFDFSIVGGPHYSSDTKVGIGLVAAGLYHSSVADSLMMPSSVSLFGDISSVGFYMLGVRGTHITPRDRIRMQYTLYFYSFLTRFWGIGYESEHLKANESRYNDFNAKATYDLLFNLGHDLYAGPSATINYDHATKVKRPELWEGQRLRVISPSLGITLQYDTRDNLSAPERGWLASLQQKFYARFLGNHYAFSATEMSLQNYFKAWKGAVIASRLHGRWAYGNVPWCLLSKMGDQASMRGYYPGRYRDKVEMDLTLELRQHVWRRNGIALWVGAGTVAPSPRRLRIDHVLPNAGIGYRWEFKHRTNIRLDFGIGRGETGFIFNINEAF